MRKWKAPADLDPECLELCAAINETFSAIRTTGSCCGHGETPFFLAIDATDSDQLACLAWCLDPCHVDAHGWRCVVTADCTFAGPFLKIEGPPGDYEGAASIAALIRSKPWTNPPNEDATEG
jgi:hypothetical protein